MQVDNEISSSTDERHCRAGEDAPVFHIESLAAMLFLHGIKKRNIISDKCRILYKLYKKVYICQIN